jgi:hypothetical protein
MKKRFFKDVETADDVILLPRKNLKDVKESFLKNYERIKNELHCTNNHSA